MNIFLPLKSWGQRKFRKKFTKKEGVMYLDGSIVKQLRRDRKMTIAELAEKSQLASSTISMIENGQRNPSIGSMERLAKALDTKITVLMGECEA